MLRQENEVIQFDSNQVDNEIKKNNEYKLNSAEVNISIKYNQKEEKDNKYFSLIEIKNSCKYIGILSENFSKEKLGINYYANNDIYIGEWKNNLKEGNGLYIYNSINNQKELFIGKWNKGLKLGKGIYYFSNDNLSNYIIFFGDVNNENFEQGFMIENNGIKKLYKGKFKDLKKEDDNGILLEGNDKAFFGKFKNDEIIEGNIIKYKIENEKVIILNIFNINMINNNNYDFNSINDLNYGNYVQIIHDLFQKKYE